MSKLKRRYVCQACGGVSSRWQGQCADCAEWNTLAEEAPATVFSEKHHLSSGGRAFAFVAMDESLALPARRPEHKEFHAPVFRQWLDGWDLANDFKPAHTPRTVDTRSAGLALDKLLPRDRNVVYDAGNFLQIVPYISVPDPSRYKQAGDFASIGMGFGVALGFARATP